MSDQDAGAMLRMTLIDVTARKQAEADQRIAAIAFESQNGMMVTDANEFILRVNQAFTAITGYSEAEAIGKTPKLLSSGRHDDNFYHEIYQHLEDVGYWEGEIYNKHKNGSVYLEHLAIKSVKNVEGKLTHYVASLVDITKSRDAENKVLYLAFYDSLTSLPNRRLLQDRLKQAIAYSMRSGHEGAVLFLDLDHFKTLNDTLGHDFGDMLLKQVATRLTTCVREGDTVARLGGDEYVMILENLSEKGIDAAAEVESVAKKILHTLNQPYVLQTNDYQCTASIGATLFNQHNLGVTELLKQADIALFQAKKLGRNTFRFFDPQMQIMVSARAEMESELHKALEQNQFQLFYQMQVDDSAKPIGVEALIRWLHPVRGLVPPIQFIPLAEESGLILSIGQWVLDAACMQLKLWEKNAMTSALTISINVSAKQFHQPDFVEQVLTTLERHAVNPNKLRLELTESMLAEDVAEIVSSMTALTAAGVRFELDDFGTGYSSLQYLKNLPLYQLKIDQSFVRDITSNSSDQAIVRTIIAMAKSLGLEVIAEGVETEEQRLRLQSKGCLHYQGYLFSKPLPIDEFEALLNKS